MPFTNWETALVTKAINKTIARKPKHAEKRKQFKERQKPDNGDKSIQH